MRGRHWRHHQPGSVPHLFIEAQLIQEELLRLGFLPQACCERTSAVLVRLPLKYFRGTA
jgi:hypothetical protein